MSKIQRPNVVQAEDMVRVTMSHHHRVEVLQSVTESLLAKIRRSINDYGLARLLDENGHAQAFITRVVRDAGLAVARD
jgi:Tfp pilus assembly PilM family ATPase